ncbi:MAG: sulfur carrier protein ThiS [Eubacterium sp.]|nr:sulfur carrier protein ThiS [Eubacterium sp.]
MVQINGVPYEADGKTIKAMVEEMGFHMQTIAVELNEQIVPRDSYREVMLKEGDRVEVVSFVGGG